MVDPDQPVFIEGSRPQGDWGWLPRLEPGSFQCVGFDSNARREDCSRQAHVLPNQQ
jgi:hypothetical protein